MAGEGIQILGGNGYAEGGARIARRPSQSGIGNNALVAPVRAQVQAYLARNGTFAAGELVVIGGGGNDTYAQFSALCWGSDVNGAGEGRTTPDSATAAIAEAANAQVALVRQIKARGAALVLLAGASDWSGNPFARHYLSDAYQREKCATPTPTPARQITAWTQQFNAILRAGTADLQGVLYLEPSQVFADMLAHPQRYGLVNTTDAACTNTRPSSSATFCSAATLAAPTQTFSAVFKVWRNFKSLSLKTGRQSTLSQIDRIFAKDVLPRLGDFDIFEVDNTHLLEVLRRIERRAAPHGLCQSADRPRHPRDHFYGVKRAGLPQGMD